MAASSPSRWRRSAARWTGPARRAQGFCLSAVVAPVTDCGQLLRGEVCLEGTLDLDADAPGLQLDCVVSDVRFPGTDDQQETLVPACAAVPPAPGEMPCWQIVPDPDRCPYSETSAVLEVHRGPATVPSESYVVARCSTGCDGLPP